MSPVFEGGGRYIGGDLAQQISAKAYTVQLVRAHRGQQIGRTPDTRFVVGEPIYNFDFDVVETLAHRDFLFPLAMGRSTTPGTFTLDGLVREQGRQAPDPGEVWLPVSVLDHPGSQTGFFALKAPAPVRLSGGSCGWPMDVSDGDLFIALRGRTGALYAFATAPDVDEGAERLNIDFAYTPMSRVVEQTNGPPLLRVRGRNDPIYVRIRAALAADHRLRSR